MVANGDIWTPGQAKLAVGSVGAQALCEFEFLAGLAGLSQGAQCFGCGEVRGGFELSGRITKKASLHGDWLSRKPGEVECDAVGGRCGAASSANRATTKNYLLGRPGDFRLPPGFFVPSQLSHLGEMVSELRIPGRKLWQQFVTNPVAGEREMSIAGVFAPRLVAGVEKGFNLGACGVEQRANDWASALRAFKSWMNSR